MIFAKSKNTLIYISLVILLILLSFRSFATHLNPYTNSDTAVQALMAYNLKLPQDLYYWGQDRLGSIVPILGNILIQVTSLSPLAAVSYVNYLFLYICFLTFTSLFKRLISKVIFALVLFLPLQPFSDILLVGQPYAAQLACIGITVFLIDRITTSTEIKSKDNFLLLPFAGVSAILAVWISDFSIITIFLLIILFLTTYIANQKINWSLEKILTLSYITFVIAISCYFGNAFISYAKTNATAPSGSSYGKFNNFEQFVQVVKTIGWRFYKTFTELDNIFLTLHNLTALAIILIILIFLVRNIRNNSYCVNKNIKKRSIFQIILDCKWIIFFLANALISSLLLVFSNWVYINDVASRYFVVSYIFSWIFIILFIEKLNENISRRLTIILLITAIFSSLSLPSYVYAFERPKSKVQQLQNIQTLGKVGFIGDYWNTYIISATNPNLIAATPHDKSVVRCFSCVTDVFSAKTMYLIKDKWLNTFPDRIEQFGWRLQKIGKPFIISGYTIAAYKRDSTISASRKKIPYFPVGETAKIDLSAFTYKGQIKQHSSKILQIHANKDSNYVLTGPYINLPEGVYQVSLKVRSPSESNKKVFLVLADVHQIELKSSQVVVEQEFDFNPSVKHNNFVIEFEANNQDSYYEFRIATDAEIIIETPILRRLK